MMPNLDERGRSSAVARVVVLSATAG